MKKIVFICLSLSCLTAAVAQESKTSTDSITKNSFNRWTIEGFVGHAKGNKPFAPGYYSSNPNSFLGTVEANSYDLGARYMISPKFGVKGALSYSKIKSSDESGSLPFEMRQIGISIQGVANLGRVLDLNEYMGRFGLLAHAGVKIDQLTSRTENVNYGVDEYLGGLVIGLTPQFRVADKLSLMFDLSFQKNLRQNLTYDGSVSDLSNNLNGELITASLGLSYSFGKEKMHGDWAKLDENNLEEIKALEKRIADIETLMNDTDKDGVPDYLDTENNSIAGVAVDTKGKMVDINRNGVPDELERYLEKSYAAKNEADSNNAAVVKKLINEGYVTTYFDFGKSKPTNVSTEGIDFMLTYLRNNPTANAQIIGHADEIGANEVNEKLSKARAEAVKDILVKAGVNASRLTTISSGEDTSVDPASTGARKLVRRVTFRVN